MHQVNYVPLAKLRELWPLLAPFLEEALGRGHGEHNLEQVLDEVLERRMQLWGVVDPTGIVAALTTRVVSHPGLRVLQIAYLGGSGIDEWGEELHEKMREFARMKNCERIEICGRLGWLKKLPKVGYEQQYVVMGVKV